MSSDPERGRSGGHEPPIRVMALHALMYCERLYYLEEVEELYVADDRVYAGRELHESLGAGQGPSSLGSDERGRWTSLELDCPSLGLVGRVDVMKRRDGRLIPYEHKRGRALRDSDGKAQAWETDAVQVAAYAMMIEDAFGVHVPEGRVRYHADRVTVRIRIDEALRRRVTDAIDRARQLRDRLERPPVTSNRNLCRRCSLAPVCLPEESRHTADPAYVPRRLFPERDPRTSLHVISPGSRVNRDGECFVVTRPDGGTSRHPSGEIGSVILHGATQISTQALWLCADHDIAVHWVTGTGRHVASLTSTAGQVQRRIRQYQALYGQDGAATRLRLARALVVARIESQRRYILRATRQDEDRRQRVEPALHELALLVERAQYARDIQSLRGYEGTAARVYWSVFNDLLGDNVPAELRFTGRTRRPATDRLSAALNFGYGLLKTAVMRAILASGLEPAIGFYHTPRSAAYPLVLDLMDLFRLLVWDIPLIGALNRGQFDPNTDFVVSSTSVRLSDQGRRKVIGLFEGRLQETWRHPVVGYSLSYARTIELEARLLEKEWSGEPGLFARLRLR